MSQQHERVAAQITAIEAEMKRVALWQAEPLAPELLQSPGAFGVNTLTFQQWLQFVLIPNVNKIVAAKAPLPETSNTAIAAVRNFDGMDEADRLIDLLGEFDRISVAPRPSRRRRHK